MEASDLSFREATACEVARRLGPLPHGFVNTRPWSWIVAQAPPGGVGEVKSTRDWHVAPTERQLRVIALCSQQGAVVRWADTDDRDVQKALGGSTHEHLVCQGDPPAEGSGYVRISGERVRVTR